MVLVAPAHCATFFFCDNTLTEFYTLSLHDALPISKAPLFRPSNHSQFPQNFTSKATPSSRLLPRSISIGATTPASRSEEHTSELQSRVDLVCRLLLEKKKRLSS